MDEERKGKTVPSDGPAGPVAAGGQSAFERFDDLLRRVIRVPKTEVDRVLARIRRRAHAAKERPS